MFDKKLFCIVKGIISILFALLSVLLIISGLVIIVVGLIAYFNAGIGVQAVFSGIIFVWLGCFGLLSLIKNGCPMPIKKHSEQDTCD